MGYEEIDHTADYALRVWGKDLRELLENAGRGVIALLTGGETAPVAEWVEYGVEATEAAGLLLRAVREILYQTEAGRPPVAFEVVDAAEEPPRARCRVGLAAEEASEGLVRRAIKAVTYHDLTIRREGEELVVTLTLDA